MRPPQVDRSWEAVEVTLVVEEPVVEELAEDVVVVVVPGAGKAAVASIGSEM